MRNFLLSQKKPTSLVFGKNFRLKQGINKGSGTGASSEKECPHQKKRKENGKKPPLLVFF
jgi:hypothetical protein